MSPVDTLHAAATRLRELAERATAGKWENSIYGVIVNSPDSLAFTHIAEDIEPDDATYIALMSPPLAQALATWLAAIADTWARAKDQDDPYLPDPDGWATHIRDTLDSHALTIAHQILGLDGDDQ